jgi:hypothetical protein
MVPFVERLVRPAWWATAVGLSATAAGLIVLFGQALTEVLTTPGLSLVDGYWIGRLPWTAVGVDLVVIGATIAVAFGTLTSWLAGGLDRRVLSALALAVAAFWWFFAMAPPLLTGYCPGCPPPEPDPITTAYSAPEHTALLLLLPAATAAAVGLSAPRARRRAVTTESPTAAAVR